MPNHLTKTVWLFSFCIWIGNPSLNAQENTEEKIVAPPAAESRSDRPPRGANRMLGMMPLLRIETVREELGVDEEQSRALDTVSVEISNDFGEQITGILHAFRELRPEERRARRRENHEKVSGIRKKVNGRLRGVLGDNKFRRLKEIEVQRLVRTVGIGVLAGEDIAAALDLTDEQKQQLRDQADGSGERGKSVSLEEVRAQVKEVLTAEQSEKLDTLFGAEFDLPQELLERGRGRRFGRLRGERSAIRRATFDQEADKQPAESADPQ